MFAMLCDSSVSARFGGQFSEEISGGRPRPLHKPWARRHPLQDSGDKGSTRQRVLGEGIGCNQAPAHGALALQGLCEHRQQQEPSRGEASWGEDGIILVSPRQGCIRVWLVELQPVSAICNAGMLDEGERIAKVLSSLDREADITEGTRNSHTHSVVRVGQGSGMTCVWVCAGREDKFVERGTVAQWDQSDRSVWQLSTDLEDRACLLCTVGGVRPTKG